MDTPSPASPALRTLRRRRSIAAAVVLAFAVSGGLAFSPGAGAEPKECPDGEPPPCSEPEPTTTTTRPRPPANQWVANVSFADASGGLGFSRTQHSEWHRAGSPSHITSPVPVVWSDAAQTRGTVTMSDPQAQLPAGNLRGFYVAEQGFSGPLCRSQPFGAVPTGVHNAEVLVAPRSTTTQADLNRVAGGLVGPLPGAPADTTVSISSAAIAIVGSQLQVTIHGHLSYDAQFPIPNVDASFDYVTTLGITESRSVDNTNEVLVVNAQPGILQLVGDGVTDDIELALAGNLEPTFRNATQGAARSAVMGLIDSMPLVQQFRAQGFVLSARKVTISAAVGIEVWPSLCRFT